MVMVMDESEQIEDMMNKIKLDKSPNIIDMKKYIRYAMNIHKKDPDEIKEELNHWDKEKVEKTIKSVERERQKPKPKRYYVSLKEPLEDSTLR